MVIIVLLLTTYLHYRKKRRRQLQDEYVYGYPVEMDLFTGNDRSPEKDRSPENDVSPEKGSTLKNDRSPEKDRSPENGVSLDKDSTLKNDRSPEKDTTPKNGITMENSFSPDDNVSPENNANAYKGLLWMKDKYEQYREQTDNKYEKLKEELARSEQKYLDLLAERGEQKTIAVPAADSVRSPLPAADSVTSPLSAANPAVSSQASAPVGNYITGETLPDKRTIADENSSDESLLPSSAFAPDTPLEQPSTTDLVFEKERQIGFLHVELDQRIKNYHELEYQNREDKARAAELAAQYSQAQQLLEAQQLKIDELNALLGHEMSKVVDLTGKLESNMRLLLHIHQELDKSLHIQQSDKSLPAENEGPLYEGAMSEVEEQEAENRESLSSANQSHESDRDQLVPLTENTKIVGWIESEEAEINTK